MTSISPTINSSNMNQLNDRQTTKATKQIEQYQKQDIPEILLSDINNPYKNSGLSDEIWGKFLKASEKADMFTQNSLEKSLFLDTKPQNLSTKVIILKKSAEDALSKDHIKELITKQNINLAFMGKPPMSPKDEQKLITLINLKAKHEIAVLDAFYIALIDDFYKPLEVAA